MPRGEGSDLYLEKFLLTPPFGPKGIFTPTGRAHPLHSHRRTRVCASPHGPAFEGCSPNAVVPPAVPEARLSFGVIHFGVTRSRCGANEVCPKYFKFIFDGIGRLSFKTPVFKTTFEKTRSKQKAREWSVTWRNPCAPLLDWCTT